MPAAAYHMWVAARLAARVTCSNQCTIRDRFRCRLQAWLMAGSPMISLMLQNPFQRGWMPVLPSVALLAFVVTA